MPFEKGKSGNPQTQWKKGQSGNPNGRRNAAKDILNELLDTEIEDRSQKERLLSKLIQMGMRGDLGAIKEVLDRTEGKSKEHIVTEEFKPLRVLEFGDDILDEK
jgi:predicted transcriptional regulator